MCAQERAARAQGPQGWRERRMWRRGRRRRLERRPPCGVPHGALMSRAARCRCPQGVPARPAVAQLSMLSWVSRAPPPPVLLPSLSPSPPAAGGCHLATAWGCWLRGPPSPHLSAEEEPGPRTGSCAVPAGHTRLPGSGSSSSAAAGVGGLLSGGCSRGTASVPAGLPGLTGAAHAPSEQCLGDTRLRPPRVPRVPARVEALPRPSGAPSAPRAFPARAPPVFKARLK